MKREKLEQALEQISDDHIAEASRGKKRRKLPWLGAAAAVLALVLVFRFVDIPMAIAAEVISTSSEPRITERPDFDNYASREEWLRALDSWTVARDARDSMVSDALSQMLPFLQASCQEFLSGNSNQLYSPINAYIGLAMTAEVTAGQTRQQLLDVLGCRDLPDLRGQTAALWENTYQDDGNEICTLASALWLDESVACKQAPMDILAQDYYASVYRQDLSSQRAVKDIRAWLNNNTGGLLESAVQEIQLPPEAVLALYSTIYFQAKWSDEFQAANNTQDTFHGLSGNTTATFMNKKLNQMYYYWGESYGAVSLSLKNNSTMWFILPDEDKSISQVLAEGEFLDMIITPWSERENVQYMKVNLSVPKFDIQTSRNLRGGLENMGITDLFQYGQADFSEAFEAPVFMTAANQAVRVKIDEQGVKAAAYIELPAAGAPMPPEEIIDFILNRPFLFVIAGNGGIPLFAGAVNGL